MPCEDLMRKRFLRFLCTPMIWRGPSRRSPYLASLAEGVDLRNIPLSVQRRLVSVARVGRSPPPEN